ncbi:MAG: hypothetical protein NVS2B16_29950 [Chloroflexota bacterium]
MHVSDRQLMELHVRALFTHGPDGRICRVNEPGGGRAPRFFIGRTREGNLWRFRSDVPDAVAHRVEELAASEPVHDNLCAEPRSLAAFRAALGYFPGSPPAHCGPAYRFPEELNAPRGVTRITPANVHMVEAMGRGWEGFGLELAARDPCWAVIDAGVAVSVCFSARRTEHVAEAGVETLEAYRGRGHARSVVCAWAGAVRSTGRIPLYSTSWENLPSRAVARALGLVQYGVDLSL